VKVQVGHYISQLSESHKITETYYGPTCPFFTSHSIMSSPKSFEKKIEKLLLISMKLGKQ
jgi:hypothetical protein